MPAAVRPIVRPLSRAQQFDVSAPPITRGSAASLLTAEAINVVAGGYSQTLTPEAHPFTAIPRKQGLASGKCYQTMQGAVRYALTSFWADDPAVWGTLLADAMHHVCDALVEETGRDRSEIAKVVLRAFRSEVEHPTGNHRGRHVDWDS